MKQVSDPASQLAYLIDMCRDKAYEAIRSCIIITPPAEALKTAPALDKLSMKFGKKHVVVLRPIWILLRRDLRLKLIEKAWTS